MLLGPLSTDSQSGAILFSKYICVIRYGYRGFGQGAFNDIYLHYTKN